jgi:hypothetical protein
VSHVQHFEKPSAADHSFGLSGNCSRHGTILRNKRQLAACLAGENPQSAGLLARKSFAKMRSMIRKCATHCVFGRERSNPAILPDLARPQSCLSRGLVAG